MVDRRLIRQRAVRNLRGELSALLHHERAFRLDLADAHGVEVPFVEDRLDLALTTALDHHEHALLRLGEHDFVGSHAGLALRHMLHVDLDADAAAAAHLGRGTGETRGPHILDADESPGRHHLEAGFEQKLFGERVAHLHGRPLFVRRLVELSRGHRRAVDAVAAGLGAHVIDGVACAAGRALDDVVVPGDAEAEDVHQRIAAVRLVESHLTTDGRDADAVAVAADPGDDALEDAAVLHVVEGTEPERIEQRDRPRPHREDVADDAADAGRRALIRLDERRMVVRFDLEDGCQAVADVHRACVLARSLQHARSGRRQRLQVHAGALVAAVLGPHHREDAELGEVRLTAEQLDDACVFVAR